LLTSNLDWEETRAYALGAGGNIFVNLKGREPAGCVEPGNEYEQVRRELTGSLLSLSDPDTGQSIVERVFRREELYHGPYVDLGPDLIVQWKDYSYWGRGRYDSSESVFQAQRQSDFSDKPLTGSHRLEGVLILQGPDIRSNCQTEGARLLDVAPTILSLLGIDPGPNLDGHILQGIFREETAADLKEISPADEPHRAGEEYGYDSEDEKKITDHLRSLGYL
jgi:predicted AlkP superfamily phosphohydrolase/phosphomutase